MKNGKYSKCIVALIIILNTFFTGGVLAVFWHTANEPAVLVTTWFGFTTGELWILSSIKKNKIQKQMKLEGENHED